MIVVTVELWPYGNEAHKQTLGVAHIINDGTGNVQRGNYDVRLFSWGNPPRVWRRGRVAGFDRLNRGPWDLLFLALHAIVARRNAPLTTPPESGFADASNGAPAESEVAHAAHD